LAVVPEYWRRGDAIQNFGDFLSDFLAAELFFGVGLAARQIRIVGSCIDDAFVRSDDDVEPTTPDTIFWGCGMRRSGGLSPSLWDRVQVLAVRGPLTRSELHLGTRVPIGDPALLIPALHPVEPRPVAGTLLVPHFHDDRSDEELLGASACDAVLRPRLANDLAEITAFIDRLVVSDFVLCGSLHAAIVAASYGVPFGFWDSGAIDLPFKWADFAASVSVAAEFFRNVRDAKSHYEQNMRNTLRVPLLTPLLTVSPFLVRPEAMLSVVRLDAQRHGPDALNGLTAPPVSRQLALTLEEDLAAAHRQRTNWALLTSQVESLKEELEGERRTYGSELDDQRTIYRLESTLALERLAKAVDRARNLERAQKESLAAANAREKGLQDGIAHLERRQLEAASLAESRAQEVDQLRLHINALYLEREAIYASTSWVVTAPLRAFSRFARRAGRLMRRTAHLVWRTVTLQHVYRHRGRPAARVDDRSQTSQVSMAVPTSAVGPALEIAEMQAAIADQAALYATTYASTPIAFPAVESPEVSVIIPVYGGLATLENCLRSLAASVNGAPSFEVVVIDDHPDDPVVRSLPESAGLRKIFNNENIGFLRSCNAAAKRARGKTLCFLNSDTIVTDGWLATLLATLDDSPEIGVVGPLMLNGDGTIQDAGWVMTCDGWGYPIGRGAASEDCRFAFRRDVDAVTGACFLTPTWLFKELGGLDDLYQPAFYEEFDYMFRAAEQGFRTTFEPRSRVFHYGSVSYGVEERDRLSGINHDTFRERFKGVLDGRPAAYTDAAAILCPPGQGPVILIVDAEVPDPTRHAGDVTMSGFIKTLRESNYRVVFYPHWDVTSEAPVKRLEDAGVMILRPPLTLDQWLQACGEVVDEILIARPNVAEALLPILRLWTRAPVSYYIHDLHHVRMKREAAISQQLELETEALAIEKLELGVFETVDLVLAPSEEEAALIREVAPDSKALYVPPYYFEETEFRFYQREHFETRRDLVFVGGFPHTPNVDAAKFLVESVMPLIWAARPEIRLFLVGYRPPEEIRALANPRVIVTGQVADISLYFEPARISLSPLRYGAGVKGKTVDALRSGIPVVSTPIGAEGISVTHGSSILIAETPDEFANCILQLLADNDLCAKLSRAGMEVAQRQFSRAATRNALDSIFSTPYCPVCGARGHPQATDVPDRQYPPSSCAYCRSPATTIDMAEALLQDLAPGAERSLLELAARGSVPRVHLLNEVLGVPKVWGGYPWFSAAVASGVAFTSGLPSSPSPVEGAVDWVMSHHPANSQDEVLLHAQRARELLSDGGWWYLSVPPTWESMGGDESGERRLRDLLAGFGLEVRRRHGTLSQNCCVLATTKAS
jgi:GT2 family glycosyltransferase